MPGRAHEPVGRQANRLVPILGSSDRTRPSLGLAESRATRESSGRTASLSVTPHPSRSGTERARVRTRSRTSYPGMVLLFRFWLLAIRRGNRMCGKCRIGEYNPRL